MSSKENDIPGRTISNNNHVNVYNNFSFSINFGDSLNLLALIAGVYIIKKLSKSSSKKKK